MGGCISRPGHRGDRRDPFSPPPDRPVSPGSSPRPSSDAGPSGWHSRTTQPGNRPAAPAISAQTAEYICEQIARDRARMVEFAGIDSWKTRPAAARKYKGVSVEHYRAETNYPSKPVDVRPEAIAFGRFCAHGTNLTSVVSALIHTNKQLVPSVKARKLGVAFTTGESRQRGASEMGRSYVSTISMVAVSCTLKDVNLYAEWAADPTTGFLQTHRLRSDTIPVVVFGDGAMHQPGMSDVSNEELYKRVNIRIISAKYQDRELVRAILRQLNIDDVKVISQERIHLTEFAPDSLRDTPNMRADEYWRRLWDDLVTE